MNKPNSPAPKAGARPRKATSRAIESFAGWSDERVGDLSKLLPASVDRASFEAWLGPRLGNYRLLQAAYAATRTPSQQRAHVEETIEVLKRVQTLLKKLPTGADEKMFLAYRAHGLDWLETSERMVKDAMRAHVTLAHLLAVNAKLPIRKGRHNDLDRDALYAEVVIRLGVPGPRGRDLGARVLKACGVTVPHDDETRADAVSRGKKAR